MVQQTEYHAFCNCGGTFSYEEDGQHASHTCKYRDISFGEYNMTSRYVKNVNKYGTVQWFRDWQ